MLHPFCIPSGTTFQQSPSNFSISTLMAPKKKMALLTLPSSNTILVPTSRHTWSEHPVAKDQLSEKVLNDPIKVGPAFEYMSSGSTAVKHHIIRTSGVPKFIP